MTVFPLSKNSLKFPDPFEADEDGLLAIGGDLTVDRLIMAYSQGIFPWYSDRSPILWWAPDPRFVMFTDNMHVSHSLRKKLKNGGFTITFNRSFPEVIKSCKIIPRNTQKGTWITADMQRAYVKLHQYGFAASVETWKENELAGGLYGVVLGNIFFGESMFSHISDASKVSLRALAFVMSEQKAPIIDCQIYTKHLSTMGAQHMPYKQFKRVLSSGLNSERIVFPSGDIPSRRFIQ
ncbi:MAG: leucyl/phenylalanyl-tRNA--protein transferase [bacterium]